MMNCWRLLRQIRCVKDVAGYMGVSTVILYWVYNTFLTTYIVLIPNYYEGKLSGLFVCIYWFVAISCMASLAKASLSNPGQVPPPEELIEESEGRNICGICNTMRPNRAHHCRRCQQCVLKMDHHCPWINNCVGEANHYAFIQLLLYAALLSGLTLIIGILHFCLFLPCTQCDQTEFFYKYNKGLMISVIVFALFMVCPMSGMLMASHINFLVDRTTIDNLREGFPMNDLHGMFLKADTKTFKEIYTDVCGTNEPWRWILPCHVRKKRRKYQFINV